MGRMEEQENQAQFEDGLIGSSQKQKKASTELASCRPHPRGELGARDMCSAAKS